METTTFPYSKIVGISGLLFFLAFMAAFLYIGLITNDHNLWIFVIGIDVVLAAITVYFSVRCLLPAIKNQTALTLDDEKLTFHVTNRVIYWKDVVEISFDKSRYTTFLSFEILGDSQKIGLGLTWIAGDNKDIYQTAQEYFEASLKEDGQLGYIKDDNI